MSAAHHLAAWGRLTLKELRETLRDRRTIATLILMPILVYPLLGMTFYKFLFTQITQEPAMEYHIAFENAVEMELFRATYSQGNQLLGYEIDPSRPLPKSGEKPQPKLAFLQRDEVPDLPTLDELVQNQTADIAIRFPKGRTLPVIMEFVQREGSALGRDVREHIERRLRAFNDHFVSDYFAMQQPPVKLPVAWSEVNVPGEAVQAFSLATLVPLVLILMTVTGAVYPAIDLTAGERERGTLEALMAAPISRTRVLLAKYAAVVFVALLTAFVNLGAMVITAYSTGFEELLFGSQGLTALRLLQVLGLLAAFAAFFSAVILALTSVARSFKEAQAYLIPLMLLSLAPGILALLPGLKLTLGWSLVPLANMVLVTRDLLDGRVGAAAMGVALLANGVWTAVALAVAVRIFGTDSVLYGSSGSWRDALRRPDEIQPRLRWEQGLIALVIIFPAFILLSSVPGRFAAWSISARLMANAVVLISLFAMWPLFLAAYGRVPWSQAFGLRSPSIVTLFAAVLAGLSLWPIVYEVEVWLIAKERIHAIYEMAKPLREELDRTPLGVKLIALAIVPALCEELFFRGFLLRAFRSAMSPAVAIVVSAMLFGLFHVLVRDALMLERFPPTALLGLVLGWLAIRTGSLWPGVVLHVVHNTTILLLPQWNAWLGNWVSNVENHTHLPWWIPAASLIPLTIAAMLIPRPKESDQLADGAAIVR